MKRTAVGKICRSRLGFTLVELVVVIAVMAILAIVAVPSFASLRQQAKEEELQSYYNSVKQQANTLVAAYNAALLAGEAPRFAGNDISTARGMQECLRLANNHPELYDIVLTNKIPFTQEDENNEEALKSKLKLYSHKDTIVICIQFLGKSGNSEDVLIKNNKDEPCSPEYCTTNITPTSCRLGADGVNFAWYVRVTDDGARLQQGAGWSRGLSNQ